MSTVFRVVKNCNYTTLSNYHFKDRRLSWKAKGLLSTMLSLPDDWNYTIEGLSKLSDDGIKATNSGLLELEKYGYLIRRQQRNDNGHFGITEYVIYEQPNEETDINQVISDVALPINDCTSQPLCQNGQTVENTAFQPFVQKRQTEKRQTENGVQLNTNILNTKEYYYSSSSESEIKKNRDEEKEDEDENRLKERLEIRQLAQKYTPELAEAVFKEVYKRNDGFKQMMNAGILENMCESILAKQKKEPIRMLPNLINTYLDNIFIAVKACSGISNSNNSNELHVRGQPSFNQFIHTEYDFDKLEKEILSN